MPGRSVITTGGERGATGARKMIIYNPTILVPTKLARMLLIVEPRSEPE